MANILCHFVQMDTYTIPDYIAKKGNQAIEEYLEIKEIKPDDSETRDWEIVDVELENEK